MDEFLIVYTWPDGREEVRYRRVPGSPEAKELMDEVDALKVRLGDKCPYSYRVENDKTRTRFGLGLHGVREGDS